MGRSALLVIPLALVLAYGGCDDDGSGGGSGSSSGFGQPVPIDDLAEEYARALCDSFGPCCAQVGLSYDAAACRELWEMFVQGAIVEPVQNGTATYDSAAAGQCLASVAEAAGQCNLDAAGPECEDIVQGTVPEGGSCTTDLECQPPPAGDADCDDGTCVPDPRGTVGDTCKWTCEESGSATSCWGSGTVEIGASCYRNDGLYCDADSNTCQPLLQSGEQGCGYDSDSCVTGAYCSEDTCNPVKGAGSDCSFSYECEATLYCSEQVCAPKKAVGELCDDYDACADGQCHEGVCEVEPDFFLQMICQQQQ